MTARTERKRSLTLNLSEEEMAVLDALADRLGMSKSAVLRQAIRFYAASDALQFAGAKNL